MKLSGKMKYRATEAATVGGAAALTSMLAAKKPLVAGMPMDMLTAVALQLLAFSGMAKKHTEKAHHAANGALAAWAARATPPMVHKLLPAQY